MSRASAGQPRGARGTLLPALGIAGAGLLAYLPALSGGFVFDDHVLVEQGALLRGPLWRIWCSAAAPDYWPVTWTSLWLEWRAWGDAPLGYHLVNVALHLAASLLLWRTLRGLRVPGAWVAGLLFAVHPVTVESAAWISERKNVLSAVPFLGAALLWTRHLDSRRARHALLALALFAVALLAKASVVMLPFVLAAVAWHGRGRLERRDALILAPFFALAAADGAVNVWFQRHNALAGGGSPRGLAERVGGSGWALLSYLKDALLPVDLGFVHAPWPVEPPQPLFYLPLALVLAAGAALFWFRRRGAGPVALALGYHALMLLPVLGLLDMAYLAVGPVSNHLQYLALMGPAALAGALAAAVAKRRPALARGAVVAVVLALAAVTWERASTFHDDLSLWQAAARAAPESAYARLQLSGSLAAAGRDAESLSELEAATRLAREPGDAHRLLALAALQAGAAETAVSEARQALLASASPPVRSDAAWVLVSAGRAAEAIPVLQALVAQAPSASDYAYWLAAALSRERRLADAGAFLERWCRRNPGQPRMEEALALTLVRLGRGDEARQHVAAALGVDRDDPRAAARLTELLSPTGGRR